VVSTLTPGAQTPLAASSGPRDEKDAMVLVSSLLPRELMPLLAPVPAQVGGRFDVSAAVAGRDGDRNAGRDGGR